jgi:hypothetical protein
MYGELGTLIALPDIPALTVGVQEGDAAEESDRVGIKLSARVRRDSGTG